MKFSDYEIVQSWDPVMIENSKITRHAIDFGTCIGYVCEIEMDGEKHYETVTHEFLSNESVLRKLQRRILNEALGIRSSPT